MTSRLFRVLRNNQGLVYGVQSSISNNPEYAFFGVNTNCKVTDFGKVIEIINNELSKIITTEKVRTDELERAKKNILRDIKFQAETANFWINPSFMKELTSYSDPILLDEYIDIVKSVTVNDVNLFIKKYIDGKELLLVGIGDFSK